MGSKHHNVVVLKRLREAIEKEKDPDRLAKLTAQFVKLNAQKRPRKSADEPSAPTTGKASSLREQYTGSVYDTMADGELVLHHIVLQIEKKQRETKRKLTEAEGEALIAEVLGAVPENERAAFEALERGEGC